MYVVGTAGHIDHGKSTLIQALTGVHPDRLKEEVERGMTIDLGFTFMALPSGNQVGIIDVPGHHRFVRNMLAGVGGIDLVLFVVAATESWMPQSQEHLEIIDLLGIQRGIVVITKTDLVEADWIDMVEDDIRERLEGTVLEGAPMVRVSSVTGAGLDGLIGTVESLLTDVSSPLNIGRPRLWVDRVFTVRGSGTVVTGTLQGGTIAVEDELEVVPGEYYVRIRALQTHGQSVNEARPGGRVAVNVSGPDVDVITRGHALIKPESIDASAYFNASFRLLPGFARPIEDGTRFKLYTGTAERMVRVKLLDKDIVQPGETALIQVELDQPVAVTWQDPFVVRHPAQQVTIGGGRVLMAPARRVRGRNHRYQPSDRSERHRVLSGVRIPECLDLELLRRRVTPDIASLVDVVITELGWVEKQELFRLIPAVKETVDQAVKEATERGKVIALDSFWVAKDAWQGLRDIVHRYLADYHRNYPLRSGSPRETLRSHLGVNWKLFDDALVRWVAEGLLVTEGARVRLVNHEVRFTDHQQAAVDAMMKRLLDSSFSPPSVDELLDGVADGEELLWVLIEKGELVRIAPGLLYPQATLDEARRRIVGYIEQEGRIDVPHVRDMLQTTRKYAVPLLEYFDQIEVTRRVTDGRVLGSKAHAKLSPF